MKMWYEVKHKGKTKKFENERDSFKFAGALEVFGYDVEVLVVTVTLYTTITTTLYKTAKNKKSSI